MKNRVFNIFLIFLLLILSYFVSQRNFEIGADTDSYKYYHSVIADSEVFNPLALEPGFFLIYKICFYFSENFRFFLFFEYFLLNIFYYIFYIKATNLLKQRISNIQTLILVGFTLFSSWYLLYSLNGLRQGLATPFVYLSFLAFINRKYIFSILLILIATSIHSTSILFFPFFFFDRFNFKTIFILFFVIALLYFTYLNKIFILFFCKITGLSFLYNFIIDYGGTDAPDRGPVFRFILYTLGMPTLFYFVSKKILNKLEQINFELILKFYFITSFPYFFLAYGGYSGRLALYCWFLVPYLYSFLISRSLILKNEVKAIAFLIFCFGILSYLLLLNSDKLPPFFKGIWGNV